MPDGYGIRQAEAMDRLGPLCVGIDPHAGLLKQWELSDDAEGLREFSLRLVEALGGRVAAFKPQSAFYERHGSKGVAVLEETLDAIRSFGSISILDVKRGDIGSTMDGYAEAYLGENSSLRADAMTVSPYLGPGSLEATARMANATGRGLYVLALTSNPEGPELQHIGGDGGSVAGRVVSAMANLNEELSDDIGPVGLVVGATVGESAKRLGIDLAAYNGIFLAPGVGAQGAGGAEVREVFGRARVLASASRSVLRAGPNADDLRSAAKATLSDISNG